MGNGSVGAARLAEIPLVLLSRPHSIRVLVDDAMGRASGSANVQMEIDAMHSTIALDESGVGYAVLSYSAVRDLVLARRLRVWRIVEPTITRSLVITAATQRLSTKPARALMRLFKEMIDGGMREGRWAPPPDMAQAAGVGVAARAFV